jgi:S1-C subfamily serine protease
LKAGALAAGACLVGGSCLLATVTGLATPAAATQASPAPKSAPYSSQAGTGGAPVPGGIDVSRVAAEVDPAVVDINTTIDALEGGGQAAGTGMVVTTSGEIVTNNHVVQGADTVSVTIPGHGTHPATLVGTDPSADIAVLRVAGVSGLATVEFGNSSTVTVGDPVVAIGNALGLGGSPTVTEGIISATGRTITAGDETGSNEETLHGLLQTDAPIAPGNSGGPLVDAGGNVIAMDTAAASAGTTGSSLGFAIPANTVERIAQEIGSHQDLPGLIFGRTPFLGVEVVDSSQVSNGGDPFVDPFGFGPVATTPNGTPGVVVAAVDPNSPAAGAGIVSGDVITAIDGHATATTPALSKVIEALKPGDTVSLSVSTGNGTQTLRVHLAQGPID